MAWCKYVLPNTEFIFDEVYRVKILTECMMYPLNHKFIMIRCINCDKEMHLDFKRITEKGCFCVGRNRD
jgi:hypothetical protein